MNSKLPCLAAGWVLVAALPSVAQELSAEAVLTQAVLATARHASIQAKVRVDVEVFDQQLLGRGVYLQQGYDRQRMIRLELEMQAYKQASSLLQVSDGRFLWTERQVAKQREVDRLDLRRLRQAWQEQAVWPASDPLAGLKIGGIGQLLAGLNENFRFGNLVASEIDGVPVLRTIGRWRRDKLLAFRAASGSEEEERNPDRPWEYLPEQLPHEVHLTLGRDDLFPYDIDFRQQRLRTGAGQGGEPRRFAETMVRLRLYEVVFGAPLDPRQFVYTPGKSLMVDKTDDYLKRLR